MSEHEDEADWTPKEHVGVILCVIGAFMAILSLSLPNLRASIAVGVAGVICIIIGWKLVSLSRSKNTRAKPADSLEGMLENDAQRQLSRKKWGGRLCSFGLLLGIISLFFLTTPLGIGIVAVGFVCLCVGWLVIPKSSQGSRERPRTKKHGRFGGALEHPMRVNEDNADFMAAISLRALELRRQNPHGLS